MPRKEDYNQCLTFITVEANIPNRHVTESIPQIIIQRQLILIASVRMISPRLGGVSIPVLSDCHTCHTSYGDSAPATVGSLGQV
ncbi:MAG: hypothetical protein IJK97_07360 [Thermoguttaceae bacterium]|nr:hypothetical protein [Thermoguttaceae bacterium]